LTERLTEDGKKKEEDGWIIEDEATEIGRPIKRRLASHTCNLTLFPHRLGMSQSSRHSGADAVAAVLDGDINGVMCAE